MPIVSEHPRARQVIHQLTSNCNQELGDFIASYADRRRGYERARESRRKLIRYLDDEDRRELEPQELLSLLDERESTVEQLRDDLALLDKELVLIKREMRRARRKMLSDTSYVEYEEDAPEQPSRPEPDRERRTSAGTWAWVKPWLRSFLPNSA